MNFDIGEAETQLCERIRRLFTGDAEANLIRLEDDRTEEVRTATLSWVASLAQTGYLNGRNGVALVVIQEQLAALAPSLFLSVEASARIFGRLIAVYGTSEQKNTILPDLTSGRTIGTAALSEQGMNIENDPLDTTGVSSLEGFRVTGYKGHVVNASISDWIAVAGKIDGEPGTAFFLIDRTNKGVFIGDRLATLGYEGAVISPVRLEDCLVSSTHVIRPINGKDLLQTVRLWEDQILTAASLGLMRRAFDGALAYAKAHRSGGKPIIAYQEIGFKLAEMLTLLQTAQLLAYRAAWMCESEEREADALAHCAKVFCAESAEKIASEALQILGGKGIIRGNPAEAGYRDAKYLQIAGTSTEISRMKIGDGLLGY
ncbi:MAG: acyl-CoA dehydrogenase [Deltaproteobacteria bacterium]|nr:acyl-CoA dehydrogenase [Deltaproteobacteria bacterium]